MNTDTKNEEGSDFTEIILKAQARIEEAKQQKSLSEPIPLPKISDDDDDDEEDNEDNVTFNNKTNSMNNSINNNSINFNNKNTNNNTNNTNKTNNKNTNNVNTNNVNTNTMSSNKSNNTFFKQDNSFNTKPVITAAEAYRIMTGISEFKSLLDACQKYIIDSIDDFKNVITYHVCNLMSKEDLDHFITSLEQNFYKVDKNNLNGDVIIYWHNSYTQNLSESELIDIINQIYRENIINNNKNDASFMFNAYEACLREIQRDNNYIDQQVQTLKSLVQQDIEICLKNKNPSPWFVFDVKIGDLLGFNSKNRQHYLPLLQKAFLKLIYVVRDEWKYKVSEIENSISRMKFKLTFPGIKENTSQTNSSSSSSSPLKLGLNTNHNISSTLASASFKSSATPISAFSSNYTANPTANNYNKILNYTSNLKHDDGSLVQADIAAKLRQIKLDKVEREVKYYINQILLTNQKWLYFKNFLKRDPHNVELLQNFQQANEELEHWQNVLLKLILDQQ